MIYKVETIKDGTEKYFFIRNLETSLIVIQDSIPAILDKCKS